MLRHGRRFGHGGHCHGGHHRHRGGSHEEGRHGGRGRWFLRGVFERLDTTPGQEKVIREAVEEMRDAVRGMKGEWRHGRDAIADALRSGAVDETQLGELFARQDDKLVEVRKAFVGALAKVHEALDEDQRRKLADMIGSGRGFGWSGPYRSWA